MIWSKESVPKVIMLINRDKILSKNVLSVISFPNLSFAQVFISATIGALASEDEHKIFYPLYWQLPKRSEEFSEGLMGQNLIDLCVS